MQELATAVGLHINTVRFHLDRLVAEGVVDREVQERAEPGRPRLSYTAVGEPGSHGDKRSYRLLAAILASCISESSPNAAEAARMAGRTWGRYLTERPGPSRRTTEEDAISQLIELLDDIGFVPELAPPTAGQDATGRDGTGREIWLNHCPFLELIEEHREIVCSVHLGLMQGALTEMRAPLAAERLVPFVTPSRCVAALAPLSSDEAGS